MTILEEYRNWKIWKWTGWRGFKRIADSDTFNLFYNEGLCPKCNVQIEKGEVIWFVINGAAEHWSCHFPDNRPDVLHAQWLAMKEASLTNPNPRFLYQNCGIEVEKAFPPGGSYKRGESFEIVDGRAAITENSPDAIKEEAKVYGLRLLKELIDKCEDEMLYSELWAKMDAQDNSVPVSTQ